MGNLHAFHPTSVEPAEKQKNTAANSLLKRICNGIKFFYSIEDRLFIIAFIVSSTTFCFLCSSLPSSKIRETTSGFLSGSSNSSNNSYGLIFKAFTVFAKVCTSIVFSAFSYRDIALELLPMICPSSS